MACTDAHHLARAKAEDKFCAVCGLSLLSLKSAALDPDYVTTLACVNPQRAIVAVMHYEKSDDSWKMRKCSEPLSQKGAVTLAESWAAALKLEVR